MNKWLTSVVFLLGIGVSASEAQFYQRPITNPNIQPGTGPVYNPYSVGGGNSPYGGGYSPFGGGGYNPYGGLLLGNAGGFQSGTGFGVGPGGVAINPTGLGVAGAFGTGGLVTPPSSNITGHPTRFNTYSQYFNNQGSAFGTNVLTNPAAQQNTTSGLAPNPNTTLGIRPQQSRTNPLQP